MRPRVAAILALGAVLLLYDIGVAVTQFAPWADYGLWITPSGKVVAVDAHGPATFAGVREGDQLVPAPHTTLERFEAAWIVPANRALAIRTRTGMVVVRPASHARVDAILVALNVLADGVFLAAATLLYVRRPGAMAFSLWLFAAGTVQIGPQQAPLLGLFPAPLAFAAWVAISGFGAIAQVFAIVPFTLRFPNDRVTPRLRPAERIAWVAFALATAAGIGLVASSTASDAAFERVVGTITTFSQVLLVAVLILVIRFFRMNDVGRAQTAWALVGFCGSLIALELAQGISQIAIDEAVHVPGSLQASLPRIAFGMGILAELLPLCAVYPVLRYRLFELSFVVNRATLFSVLTLAAIGTLAGVNWLAQRIVSEKLALVAQPIAAILIGLAYMRVRAWTKSTLERLFFRRRFHAEQHLSALAASLATAVSVDAIDAMLVAEAVATLELRSAAVFREIGPALARAADAGWTARERSTIEFAIAHAEPRALLALDGLPTAPDEPVLAIPLLSAGELVGIVFYGRHRDATEIDPEERSLLLRICAAAAPAYQIALLKARLTASAQGAAAPLA